MMQMHEQYMFSKVVQLSFSESGSIQDSYVLTLIFGSLSTTLQAFSTLNISELIALNKQKSHGKTSFYIK